MAIIWKNYNEATRTMKSIFQSVDAHHQSSWLRRSRLSFLAIFLFAINKFSTPMEVAVAMVVVAAEVEVVAVVATEDVVVATAARVAVAMEVAKPQPMALHQPLVAMEATARARARARIEPATNPQRARRS